MNDLWEIINFRMLPLPGIMSYDLDRADTHYVGIWIRFPAISLRRYSR